MRKIVVLLFLSIFYLSATGQISLTYNGKLYRVMQTSIVKDSAGKSYVYADWMAMLTSGEYNIKPINPGNSETDFVLTKLSKEEQKRRLEAAPKPIESNGFRNKKKIDAFSEKDMKGLRIDSKELKGKIVVLNFWFINCPPCRHERPYLNQLVKEYAADSNIVFVAIALDDKRQLETFLKENPFSYRVIPNGGGIAKDNDVDQYPTHVILDKEGKIIFNTVSYNAVTGYWLRKTIEEIKNTSM
jgi:thiol-disulfide isomerase/thioredoxin